MFPSIRTSTAVCEGSQVLPACPFDKRELLKRRWVWSIVEIILKTEVSLKFLYMLFTKSVYTIQ